MRPLARPLCVGLGLLATVVSAAAHPHVLVTATADLVFGPANTVISIHEVWTFDEMYTAFAITGFGKTASDPSPDDLQDVAKQNVEDLVEFHYFTDLKGTSESAQFSKAIHYSANLLKTSDDVERLQLTFDVPLKKPMTIGRQGQLRIYDPSYFTAFSFPPGNSIRLVSSSKCAVNRAKPQALAAIDQMALSESFFTNMLPGSDFGVKLAETIHISCP